MRTVRGRARDVSGSTQGRTSVVSPIAGYPPRQSFAPEDPLGLCCVGRSDDRAGLTGEVRRTISSLVSSSLGVRRLPLSGRGDRGGGALVPALRPVVPG